LIRKAILNDVKNIFDVYLNAVTKLKKEGIEQWDEIYPDINTVKNDVQKGEMYVMVINGHIAAAGVINDYTEDYENGNWKYDDYRVIHRLCVNTYYQNMGFGKKMLEYIEDEIKKMGFKSVRIDVFPKNTVAVNMYENAGYKCVGRVEYRKGTFLLYEKPL